MERYDKEKDRYISMEAYNKEKHHDLVMEHMKQVALENGRLDAFPLQNDGGNGFVELVVNDNNSIILNVEEYECFRAEANAFAYHETMMNYVAPADENTKDQPFVFKVPQGQTSLNYHKWTLKIADKKIADRINKAKKLRNKKLKK